MKRKIQLECLVFRRINNTIEYLIMKRIPSKGGFWQPPCGGLEDSDKSKLDAAFRELKEEANVSRTDVLRVLEDIHQFVINKHYLTSEPIKPIQEFVFGFEVKKDIDVSISNNIDTEHDEIKWVSFEEAMKLLKWKNNKDAFVKIHNKLLKN
jgi:8-oxo-dGTP pyrophosphatase MutT (NUDIX family)